MSDVDLPNAFRVVASHALNSLGSDEELVTLDSLAAIAEALALSLELGRISLLTVRLRQTDRARRDLAEALSGQLDLDFGKDGQ